MLGGCGGDAKDAQVARINDETISLRDFDRQLRILKSLRPETQADELTKRQVLEQMVKQQLLCIEAKREGLDKDPSVQDAIQKQREAVKQELLDNIKNAQAQLDQLDRAVEEKVLIERLLQARKAGIKVTEAEIKKAYDDRKAQAGGAALPPMMQMRDQLLQQVQLEKLVDEAKPRNTIQLFPNVAARATLD